MARVMFSELKYAISNDWFLAFFTTFFSVVYAYIFICHDDQMQLLIQLSLHYSSITILWEYFSLHFKTKRLFWNFIRKN